MLGCVAEPLLRVSRAATSPISSEGCTNFAICWGESNRPAIPIVQRPAVYFFISLARAEMLPSDFWKVDRVRQTCKQV